MTSHVPYRSVLAILACALMLTACGGNSSAQQPASTSAVAPTTAAPATSAPAPEASPAATIQSTVAAVEASPAPPAATTQAPASVTAAASTQPVTLATQTVQVPGLPGSLTLPEGFNISVFAKELPGAPRLMAFSPEGVLYASIPQTGQVVMLPDANHDGVADSVAVVANGLNRPHGLTFHDNALWVADTDAVIRLTAPDAQGKYQQRDTIIGDLPANGQHWSRTIGFGPDEQLYVAVGSDCNVCIEKDARRAAITRYAPDGSNPQPFAIGLRNAVGFVWNNAGELVATTNGRDNLGDDVPPETINIARGGEDFGWPRCHAGDIVDPDFGGDKGCTGVTAPAFKMQAHSAPLGLRFYTGDQFPAQYRGDLFVAFHGSWNRNTPTGYKVVHLHIENNRPVAIDDFITGWQKGNNAWGRPVDIIVGPDGNMFISDDGLGVIYRVAYGNAAASPTNSTSTTATSATAASATPAPHSTGLTFNAATTQLRFEPATAAITASQALTLTFTNPSSLQHNWVLVPQGQEQAIDTAAASRNGDATGIAGVIATSPVLATGDAVVNLPALQPGTYSYICTVPGHLQAGMRGTLTVR